MFIFVRDCPVLFETPVQPFVSFAHSRSICLILLSLASSILKAIFQAWRGIFNPSSHIVIANSLTNYLKKQKKMGNKNNFSMEISVGRKTIYSILSVLKTDLQKTLRCKPMKKQKKRETKTISALKQVLVERQFTVYYPF